jgi:hypothetical protein
MPTTACQVGALVTVDFSRTNAGGLAIDALRVRPTYARRGLGRLFRHAPSDAIANRIGGATVFADELDETNRQQTLSQARRAFGKLVP